MDQSSSEPQRLLCSGKGFDLKIKWFSNSTEKPHRALEVSVMENGCVKVDSEILVPQQEWDQGVTYTCQIVDEHSGKTANKSTSICAGKHTICDTHPLSLSLSHSLNNIGMRCIYLCTIL